MNEPLMPTLWRTCRVIAGRSRLKLLAQLARGGPACVQSLAKACGLERTVATEALRAIQARGLARTVRSGRWVVYDLQPDPLVKHAAAVLSAVIAAIRRGDTHADIARAATAFTHPRRLVIVRALASRPAAPADLSPRCGISRQALHRHLRKLARRGIAASHPDGTWHLLQPATPLARDLLHIACSG